jgi:hypothetical protein
VAVTGVDEDNLVACQLASGAFGVRRVLARMNNPRNRAAFRALHVPTVNVTDEMTDMIERNLELSDHMARALPELGDLVTAEITVPDGFSPRSVTGLGLPPSTIVVSVTREDSGRRPRRHAPSSIPGDQAAVRHPERVDRKPCTASSTSRSGARRVRRCCRTFEPASEACSIETARPRRSDPARVARRPRRPGCGLTVLLRPSLDDHRSIAHDLGRIIGVVAIAALVPLAWAISEPNGGQPAISSSSSD